MTTSGHIPDGFHTKPLKDGSVEFRLVHQGRQLAGGSITPEQLSTIVTNFLNAAHHAFHLSNKTIDRSAPVTFSGEATHVQRWAVGQTSQPDQQALIVEVGEASIALVVQPEKIRDLARYLIVASADARSSLTPYGFLRSACADFVAGLNACRKVLTARTQIAWGMRRASWFAWISGRSFREFRTISIMPDKGARDYQPIKKCIYCGALKYSTKPGLEDRKFGGEHIVPEGIGGTLELPEASCQKCETETGAIVEGDALGRTLKALRVLLKLKKKGSGPHPKVLPLSGRTPDGIDITIPEIPIENYPVAFMLPTYMPPEFAATATHYGKAIRGAMVYNLQLDMSSLQQSYNISSFAPAYWDNAMLCRMLAKIGHSLAVAELGQHAFKPMLTALIYKGEPQGVSLVGCAPEYETPPKSSALHSVSLGYQRHSGKTFVVASVRLFARYGAPIYRVVVGESAESSIARFTRVLASKISLMPSR